MYTPDPDARRGQFYNISLCFFFFLHIIFQKTELYHRLLVVSDTFTLLLLNYKTIVSLSSPKIPFNEVRYWMDCLSRNRYEQEHYR